MTETTFDRIFVDGTANAVPNSVLEELLYRKMLEVPLPDYTDAEWAYAAALKATYPDSGMLPGLGARVNREIAREVEKKTEGGKRAINDFVLPFYHGDDFSPGSTDVGDVSWLTPTAQFDAVCEPAGVPGHSWQIVSCGVSSMGDKGLLYAAKVLALAAIDLFQKPEILAAARAEFEERTKKGYTCPIEPGAVPLAVC